MFDEGTVTAHAGVAAVEQGIRIEIVGVDKPVPIRLVSPISAFFPEGAFVRPREVSVPCQKVALSSLSSCCIWSLCVMS